MKLKGILRAIKTLLKINNADKISKEDRKSIVIERRLRGETTKFGISLSEWTFHERYDSSRSAKDKIRKLRKDDFWGENFKFRIRGSSDV